MINSGVVLHLAKLTDGGEVPMRQPSGLALSALDDLYCCGLVWSSQACWDEVADAPLPSCGDKLLIDRGLGAFDQVPGTPSRSNRVGPRLAIMVSRYLQ